MVLVAAAVFAKNGNKPGKALLSRQFVEMSRGRTEGLLASFPKLITSTNAQHTYVETDMVRYVYQPMEKLYVVAVTSKHSNIVQDLATLRLLSKLVPDVCGAATPEAVQDKVFDLMFALDEIITSGGYKESITVRQVHKFLEMNSHDEMLAKMIKKEKETDARLTATNKAKELAKARKEAARAGVSGAGTAIGGMVGFGSDSARGGMGGGSSGSPYDEPKMDLYQPASTPKPSSPAARGPKRGMGLRAKTKNRTSALMKNLAAEDRFAAAPAAGGAAGAGGGAGASAAVEEPEPATVSADMVVKFEENLKILMGRDGSLSKMEVRGSLAIGCNVKDASHAHVTLARGDTAGFQFQPHPNIDKRAFTKSAIVKLKDPKRKFPVGKDANVVKWRSSTTDDSRVPIVFNCWPDEEDTGVMSVNIEYTLQRKDLTLTDVVVRIPLPGGAAPSIVSCDGSHNHLPREHALEWSLIMIDASNPTGELQFTIEGSDDTAFFPLGISFRAKQCLIPLQVEGVATVDDSGSATGSASFAQVHRLTTLEYTISDDQ